MNKLGKDETLSNYKYDLRTCLESLRKPRNISVRMPPLLVAILSLDNQNT